MKDWRWKDGQTQRDRDRRVKQSAEDCENQPITNSPQPSTRYVGPGWLCTCYQTERREGERGRAQPTWPSLFVSVLVFVWKDKRRCSRHSLQAVGL